MGGGDVSAIADRIAGRDLDRDAAADRLDSALASLGLASNVDILNRRAVEDVEVLGLASLDGPAAYASTVADLCVASLPFQGVAHVAALVAADLPMMMIIEARATTHDKIARSLHVSRRGLPPRVYECSVFSAGEHSLGCECDAREMTTFHAVVGGEIWRLLKDDRFSERMPLRKRLSPKLAWRAHRGASDGGLAGLDRSFMDYVDGNIEAVLRDGKLPDSVNRSLARTFADEVSLGLVRGARSMMLRRFNWGVTIGHPGFTGAFVECSPEGARALFADRNVVGGKRRTALRHWVKEHYRRGHTPEESHKVREHLRGVERFTWHGLDVKLQVPSAEIEAAGLLARSGR